MSSEDTGLEAAAGSESVESEAFQRPARADGVEPPVDAEPLFPQDDELALKNVHPLMDPAVYAKIHSCDAKKLSEDEKKYTDDDILKLNTGKLRELCKKCDYFIDEGKNKKSIQLSRKSLSTTGNKEGMKGRLLAWFHLYRQEAAGAGERAFSCASTWTEPEDARLMEIMCDKNYQSQVRFIHQKSSRAALDAADGSPMVSTWRLVIAVLFNNFGKYKPPFRSPDHDIFKKFNPNDTSIPRRTPEQLRNPYAALRSRITIVYRKWKDSGNNDPEVFPSYVDLNLELDRAIFYFWQLFKEQNDYTFLNQALRLLPGNAGVDTSDPDSILRSASAAGPQGRKPLGDKRSPTERIILKLDNLQSTSKEAECKENAYWGSAHISTLMQNRDRAQNKVDTLAEEIRELGPASKKRKLMISRYKLSFAEYIMLEKQVATATKVAFDREIENDDASFLFDDSDDDE